MHLQVAERILRSGRLGEDLRAQIAEHVPALYLGSVAPDVQTVSGAPRAETHFYDLPPDADHQAHLEMLVRYPELACASELTFEHALFVAAYRAHLMLDLRWYREVLIPFFVAQTDWADLKQRFLAHNILLTFLDRRAVGSLPSSARETLLEREPDSWLPFVKDTDLHRWREMLAEQLRPDGSLLTIDIYAGRLSMSPAEFASHLKQPEWMEEQVFGKVPLDLVQSMMALAVEESAELISGYLSPAPDEGYGRPS